MMTPGASDKIDPVLHATAARLAKEVVQCDDAILSLMVVDKMGNVLAVERSPRLKEDAYVKDDVLPKLGVLLKLLVGAAGNISEYMGRLDFIAGGFKNQKVLLVNLREYDLSIGLRLLGSANAEYSNNKSPRGWQRPASAKPSRICG